MKASLTIVTASAGDTRRVGHVIGEQAQPGDVYLLTGPLGAGKTCLTQGLAAGLGVTQRPRSPTFVLMTRYQGRLTLHHMDLYRVGDPMEAWDLGLEEYLNGTGVCAIEWADQAEEVFPENALWIDLAYSGPGLSPDDSDGSPTDETGKRLVTIQDAPQRFLPLIEELAAAFPGTGERV